MGKNSSLGRTKIRHVNGRLLIGGGTIAAGAYAKTEGILSETIE